MQLQRVTYQQADLLYKAGFDRNTDRYYQCAIGVAVPSATPAGSNMNNWREGYRSAPTIALACKWLREIKGIHIHVESVPGFNLWYPFVTNDKGDGQEFEVRHTHDEAESVAFYHALILIIQKTQTT